jgi:hypothetical protein
MAAAAVHEDPMATAQDVQQQLASIKAPGDLRHTHEQSRRRPAPGGDGRRPHRLADHARDGA